MLKRKIKQTLNREITTGKWQNCTEECYNVCDERSSEVLDQEVQQLAKVAVELNEEILLADNLSKALGPCGVARDTWETVWVDPLCG